MRYIDRGKHLFSRFKNERSILMSHYLSRFKLIIALVLVFVLMFTLALPHATATTQPEADTPLNQQQLQKLSVQNVRQISDGVQLDLGGYQSTLHLLSPDLFKFSILPDGSDEKDSPAIQKKDWQTPAFVIRDQRNQVVVKTDKLTIMLKKKPFAIKVLDQSGRVISEDCLKNGASSGYENGKPYVFKKTDKSENFYGFGEQTGSKLNKRGTTMGMWNTDAYGYTNDTKYVYTTIPFFIGLKKGNAYGILFDNSYRSYYNMAKESDDYYYFYANGGPLTYYFMNGPDISHVIDQYTELTGRINLPPEWALGLHQSSWGYTRDQLTQVAQTYRDKQIPLDALHFDIDYMNGFRVFTWKDDYKKALDKLKQMGGLHAVAINDPGVKADDQYSIYQDGTAKDYWVKKADGKPYVGPVWPKDSVFPDFLRSTVRDWWAGHVADSLLGSGADGIWNDMNEPAVFNDAQGFNHTLPLDAYGTDDNGNKILSTEFHNLYGHLEDEATYQAWQKTRQNERPFILSRDMFAGTQRYAAVWTGDSLSDWEHLQMSLPMNMNLGLSGAAFVGNDIGGFGNEATPELFARWIELGSFLPYSRIHYDGTSDKSYTQEPWSFGSDVEKISKKYIDLRYQLLPYLYNAFYNAAETGRPVQQPLVFQYQHDRKTYNISDQFLFGDSMMVAPIVEQGKTSRSVYLPKGETWVDFDSQKEYHGGQTITVNAPLDSMPIFVKKDSIIPSRDVQQYTGEKPLKNLILDTYLDSQASYSFYEDDGQSLDHDHGAYNLTNFQVEKRGGRIVFSQDKQVSNYASAIQSYTLKLHNVDQPSTVSAGYQTFDQAGSLDQLNRQDLGYYYDSTTKELDVKIPAGLQSKVFIR